MRDAVAANEGLDPAIIEPQVPVDLVIDHSVQVDRQERMMLLILIWKSNLNAIENDIHF